MDVLAAAVEGRVPVGPGEPQYGRLFVADSVTGDLFSGSVTAYGGFKLCAWVSAFFIGLEWSHVLRPEKGLK